MPGVDTTALAAQQLIELKLAEPLAAWIAARRSGRPIWTWQELAEELGDLTGVHVSREWLRRHFGEAA